MIQKCICDDEVAENLINITERHCKISKVMRTPKGSSFDRAFQSGGYIPPMKQVGEAPSWYKFGYPVSAPLHLIEKYGMARHD